MMKHMLSARQARLKSVVHTLPRVRFVHGSLYCSCGHLNLSRFSAEEQAEFLEFWETIKTRMVGRGRDCTDDLSDEEYLTLEDWWEAHETREAPEEKQVLPC